MELYELPEFYDPLSSTGGMFEFGGCSYITGCLLCQSAAAIVRLRNKHPKFYRLVTAALCLCSRVCGWLTLADVGPVCWEALLHAMS